MHTIQKYVKLLTNMAQDGEFPIPFLFETYCTYQPSNGESNISVTIINLTNLIWYVKGM